MTRPEGEPADNPETIKPAQAPTGEPTPAEVATPQRDEARSGLDAFLDSLDTPESRERYQRLIEWTREVVVPLVLEELASDPRFAALPPQRDADLIPEPELPESDLEPSANGERERVRLSGRAGADASFRTTRNGTLIGRFPLAVHEDENTTTWHPVLAFNQRAEQLKEVVKRGAALDVVGYLHTREAKGRDEETRIVQEIYAVSVKAQLPRQQGRS